MLRKRQGERSAKKSSPIRTFATVSTNLLIEPIADPANRKLLRLHTWDGTKASTSAIVKCGGDTYAPPLILSELVQAVRFPNPSKDFGHAHDLVSSMGEFLSTYARLPEDAAKILCAFGLASWFVDCFSVAPVLYLSGPEHEAGLTLRLLSCICRRSLQLADVDIASLRTLPKDLNATMLVNQRKLSREVRKIVEASRSRHFCVARGGIQLYVYGAKAFSAESESVEESGVHVCLAPLQSSLPLLTEAKVEEAVNDFQARLVRYRMLNFQKVFDMAPTSQELELAPGLHEHARAWLSPLFESIDLRDEVESRFRLQSQRSQAARLTDHQALVAEALLFLCHRPTCAHFFVGELSTIANTLLKGRHDTGTLTDRKTGLLLRALGFDPQRVVHGYRLILSESIRERIHQIAAMYRVPAATDGQIRCRHCGTPKNGHETAEDRASGSCMYELNSHTCSPPTGRALEGK